MENKEEKKCDKIDCNKPAQRTIKVEGSEIQWNFCDSHFEDIKEDLEYTGKQDQ